MSVFQKVRGTTSDNFAIGIGKVGDKYLEADTGGTNSPFVRYNDTTKHWEISNNGLTIYAPDLDEMLEDEPTRPDNTYSLTRVMGQVTQEKWVRTADASTLKIIDYTYASGKVATEDRKVYADDGLTVLARLTCAYTYAGNLVTGVVRVRVV